MSKHPPNPLYATTVYQPSWGQKQLTEGLKGGGEPAYTLLLPQFNMVVVQMKI